MSSTCEEFKFRGWYDAAFRLSQETHQILFEFQQTRWASCSKSCSRSQVLRDFERDAQRVCWNSKSIWWVSRFSIECRKAKCFALLNSVIGSKFSHHFFNQSEVKPKPIMTHACTFSHALCWLCVITSSFDSFTGLSPSFVNGLSNYFGFGFTTLDWNSL